MSKFRVTYPSGAVEITEQSDCSTLEQFVNAKFGSSDYAANGVTVELISASFNEYMENLSTPQEPQEIVAEGQFGGTAIGVDK